MDHFYTTSIQEFDSAVGALGYTNRGFAGHIWTTQQPRTIPLYRLWNPVIQDHLYTTSNTEQDDAVANLKYMKEGVVGFVYPRPMCHAAPLYRLFSSSGSDHLYTWNAAERQGLIRPGASTYADEGIAAYLLA
ncbi:hypothetical protein BD779DRAFT_1582024 [Infundibulicybe gibba]|nr:hypothetical protein BD779DRAFT_1582024 [Infundibulicybe gibba]